MKTDLDMNSHLTVPPQIMSRVVDDETVLLDIAQGVYFGLDGVGKRIWENVANGLSLRETAAAITTEFEVDEARAEEDVIKFTADLVERGLLKAD
jgi:hypothetical protein